MPEDLSRRDMLEVSGGLGAAALLLLSGCRRGRDSREVDRDREKVGLRAKEASSTVPGRLVGQLEHKGVKINLYASEKVGDKDLDLGIFDALRQALDFIPKFLDLPSGLELNILIKGKDEMSNASRVDVKLRDVTMTKSGSVAGSFDYNRYINLRVDRSDDVQNLIYAFVAYIQLLSGTYVLNNGFSKGLSGAIARAFFGKGSMSDEVDRFADGGDVTDAQIAAWFTTLFPELRQLAVEDIAGLLLGSPSSLPTGHFAASFVGELRIDAWERFLVSKYEGRDRDFVRKLFGALKNAARRVWSLDDLKEAGNEIDSEFAEWLDDQVVFKDAQGFRVVKAFERNGKVYVLHLKQVAVDTGDKRIPKSWQVMALDSDLTFVIRRHSTNQSVRLTVAPDVKGFSNHTVSRMLETAGIPANDLRELQLFVGDEKINILHLIDNNEDCEDDMLPSE